MTLTNEQLEIERKLGVVISNSPACQDATRMRLAWYGSVSFWLRLKEWNHPDAPAAEAETKKRERELAQHYVSCPDCQGVAK
jgi:hypothetical protein